MRPGDEILLDPGLVTLKQPHSEREYMAWTFRLSEAYARGSVPLLLRRGGETMTADVRLDPAPEPHAVFRQVGRSGTYYIAFVAFGGMALLLARRARREDPDRRLVALALALLGAAFGLNYPQGDWPLWLLWACVLIINLCTPTSMALLAWFAWSSPNRPAFVSPRWAAAALTSLVTLAAGTSILDNFQVIRSPLPGNWAQIYADILLLCAVVAGLGWQRRKARTLLEKRRVDVLFGAFAICIAIAVWLVAVTHDGLQAYEFGVVAIGCTVIPLSFAASAARYRLFDLDPFARRVGVHALSGATALLVFFTISTVAADLVVAGSFTRLGVWLGVAAIVALGAPVRVAAQRAIDGFFAHDGAAILSRCSAAIGAVVDAEGASSVLERLRERLGAREVRMRDVSELPRADLDRLRRRGALHVVELRDPTLVDRLLDEEIDLLVCIPYEQGGAVESLAIALPIAPVTLGREERDALRNVGCAVAASLRQHAARSSLEHRVATGDDARRQIAMELHDGIGATLATARVMAQLARRNLAEPAGPELDALEQTLSDGLTDLRLALVSVDDRRGSWPELHARIRRHVGDACAAAGLRAEVRIEGVCSESDAPPAVRLAALRIVQEAVTNTVRHASARAACCRLIGASDLIRIVFEDDGQGLPEEAAFPIASTELAEGNGIRNMRRRVRDLGGDLALERAPSGGTRVAASIPLRAGQSIACSCDVSTRANLVS